MLVDGIAAPIEGKSELLFAPYANPKATRPNSREVLNGKLKVTPNSDSRIVMAQTGKIMCMAYW